MIIGISGKARSGKDQFGEYLTEAFLKKYGRNFFHKAFAEQLKSMCGEHFDLDKDQLYGNKKEIPDLRFPKDGQGFSSNPADYWTSREIMQEFGGFYRRIDYNFWVHTLDKNIEHNIKNGRKDFIITDVRHINECEYVKSKDGVLIRVIRESADKIHGMAHESETALDEYTDFDIEINNDGTLEDLYEAAENVSDTIITLELLMTEGGTYHGG